MSQPLIIAIGNGACNIADSIQSQGFEGAKFAFLDTEPDDLENHSGAGKTILLPSTGAERYDAFNRLFASDVERVVIIACLGGHTGTHFSLFAARVAKLAGKSPVCVVTLPFDFEGARRKVLAKKALDAIKECTPKVQVFDNEDLNKKYPDLGVLDAFKKVDMQMAAALRKIFICQLE